MPTKETLTKLKIATDNLYDLAYGLDFLAQVCYLCEEILDAEPEHRNRFLEEAQKVQNSLASALQVFFHHTLNLAETLKAEQLSIKTILKNQEV